MTPRHTLTIATLTLIASLIAWYHAPLHGYYAAILDDGDMHNDWLTHLPPVLRTLTHLSGHALAWLSHN